ncbi:MAG: lipopolysaccharide biosynthesis protein [Anaerolineales bacterium]
MSNLAQRGVHAISWNIITNLLKAVVLLGRSIFLARLINVDAFGVYGFASSLIMFSIPLANFGLEHAFLHRAPESEDEDSAAAVHFTLKLLFLAVWSAALIGTALLFLEGARQIATIAMTLAYSLIHLGQTPRFVLIRRVIHRRLALLNLLNAIVTTIAAIGLAYAGFGLWALLATDFITGALTILFLYVYKPVWLPRLRWNMPQVRYFLGFGAKSLTASTILQALNELDDLWTGIYLGNTALGLYSRAYTFATYPRQVIAAPIESVSGGIYAELKTQRARLSRAFFATNALMVRVNFIFAGWLALIAPEFIRLVIGEKWLPMLTAFRLMMFFILLDPLKLVTGNLFSAIGHPEILVRVRLMQLIVMITGLYLLGPRWGINGVAFAVNLMALVGLVWLLIQARTYVDLSLRALFGVPSLAMLTALGAAQLLAWLPQIATNDWYSAITKTLIFACLYGSILFLAERNLLRELVQQYLKKGGG